MGDGRLRSVWLAALAILVLGAAGGCGPNGGATGEEALIEGIALPTAVVENLVAEAPSEEQKAALRDGSISFQEYEAGLFRALDCLRKLGVSPTEPVLAVKGTVYRFTYGVPEDDDALFKAADGCLIQHRNTVAFAWSIARMPTEAERQEVRQPFIDCLRDAGVEVPEAPTERDWLNIARNSRGGAWSGCQTFIEETYAIEAYSGG